MRSFVLISSLLFALSACGKKDPAPAPAPTAPAPAVDDAAPAAASPDAAAPAAAPDTTAPTEPEVAPAPSRKGFIAWGQNPDGELETALFIEGEATPLAKKAGVVAVAVGDKVFHLSRETSSYPLKPCDEPGEAGLVALAITGVEPTVPKRVVELGDLKQRPKEGESWIHNETLKFIAQAGPWVLVHHEMNSDTCPIPAGGAVYDTWRALDLSALGDGAPTLSPTEALYGAETAWADIQTKAIADGKALVKKAFPDAEEAELDRVLKLYTPRFDWSDEGKVVFSGTVAGDSVAFSGMVDEEGYAAEKVTLPNPSTWSDIAAPPAAVLEYWKAMKAEGRGFSPVSGQALETLAMWLSGK
jgi:hypothetical protein